MLKSASVYVESATKECSSFEQLAPDMEDEEEKDGKNNNEEEDTRGTTTTTRTRNGFE